MAFFLFFFFLPETCRKNDSTISICQSASLILSFHFPLLTFLSLFLFHLPPPSSFLSIPSLLLLLLLSPPPLFFHLNFLRPSSVFLHSLCSAVVIRFTPSAATFSFVQANLAGSVFLPNVNSSLHVETSSFFSRRHRQLSVTPLQLRQIGLEKNYCATVFIFRKSEI